jgi:N-acetylglucosamine malate deacetylase 1
MSSPVVLALFAHPDDIEFFAAGTMLLLRERGWEVHYCNLCAGNGGSVQRNGPATAAVRLLEAQEAARLLGAEFYPPVSPDLELLYQVDTLRRVAAIVRQARPSIVLTHARQDYMEDHMNAARLAVSAAFCHGVPNFITEPEAPPFFHDVTVYHAMPYGLRDPMRQQQRAGLYANTARVHERKRAALAAHASQKNWLDVSQGAGSYLDVQDGMSRAVGALSGCFEHAEGWSRHLHFGFSATDCDPLRETLGADAAVDEIYENSLKLG